MHFMPAITSPGALSGTDAFQKLASRLRVTAWLWILLTAAALALHVDLTTLVAVELAGLAAVVLGPGSLGLGLSFVIDRVSYLTADLSWI